MFIALEEGETFETLGEKFADLGVLPVGHEPRVGTSAG